MASSKTEEIKRILRMNIRKCPPSYGNAYVYGSIPMDKCMNAISEYAPFVSPYEVLGLIDTTIFGTGKKGMLFTETGYYYKIDNSPGYYEYSDDTSWSSFGDYNVSALNDMLSDLFLAEVNQRFAELGDRCDRLIERLNDLIDDE